MRTYRDQLKECHELGLNKETRFDSFEENHGMLPLFPNNKMTEALLSGEWKGIKTPLCGKFGGDCSSRNPECVKLRESFVDPVLREKLNPINTAPRDGTYIELYAPSGYIGVKMRSSIGYWGEKGWRTHSNDWFTEGGADATHWLPCPDFENL